MLLDQKSGTEGGSRPYLGEFLAGSSLWLWPEPVLRLGYDLHQVAQVADRHRVTSLYYRHPYRLFIVIRSSNHGHLPDSKCVQCTRRGSHRSRTRVANRMPWLCEYPFFGEGGGQDSYTIIGYYSGTSCGYQYH